MKPVGIIFDFDGVIADSLSLHLLAWDKAFSKVFSQQLPIKVKQSLVGKSTQAIAQQLCSIAKYPSMKQKLIEEKNFWIANNAEQMNLMPGVLKMFNFLSKNKYPFGIASNSPKSFLFPALKYFGFENVAFPVLGRERLQKPQTLTGAIFSMCKTNGNFIYQSQ